MLSVGRVVRIGHTFSIDAGCNVREISWGWSLVDTIFNIDELPCALTLPVQLILPLKKLVLIAGIVHGKYSRAASSDWGGGRRLKVLLIPGIVCS